MTIHTARPRLPTDNHALYRDTDADAESLPGLMRSLTPPTEDQVTAAFAQSILDLAREYATDFLDSDAAAARLALRVAARLAHTADRPLLNLIIRAEAPLTRCAFGSESAAEEVRKLSNDLREIADKWDREADLVLGEAS